MRRLALIAALILCATNPAYAISCGQTTASLGSCSTAGEWVYDSSNATAKFCNGTNWITMKGGGSTLGTCSTAGTLNYSAANTNYEFCDGANWQPVGNNGTVGTCSVTGTMTYDSTNHVMKWCNGTNWIDMTGAAVLTSRCVFVTSTTYTGNLGGVAGANTDCATRATAGGLPGTYKAWIAVTTGTDDPATTFTHSTLPYKMVDGTLIANNWADLTDGTLDAGAGNGINKDETGATNGQYQWTNVATNGTAKSSGSSHTYNCSGWTSALSSRNGVDGQTYNDSTWTDHSYSLTCDTTLHLYCFQQ